MIRAWMVEKCGSMSGLKNMTKISFRFDFVLINGQKNAKGNESYLSRSSLLCMIVVCILKVRSTYISVHTHQSLVWNFVSVDALEVVIPAHQVVAAVGSPRLFEHQH